MFSLLAHAWRTGKIDLAGLDAAVVKGWIDQAQAGEIVAADGHVGVLAGGA